MKITFIRHTKVDVPIGTCYGNTDVDVAPTFKEEAAEVKKRVDGRSFDAVFTSPLQRCVKLAEYCGYPDAIRDSRLKEINFGEWEGRQWDELFESHVWHKDWRVAPSPGAESFLDLYNRVAMFLDEVTKEPHGEVVIFCHAGVIQAAMVHAGVINFNQIFEQITENGAAVELTF